jgi:hypothetical protein
MQETAGAGASVPRVVQIEYTLELKNMFRIYLAHSKRRLIIGALIFVVATSAVAGFFAFIGETEFLLLTSAMFIGFPAIALIGQVLRAHASYRKYLAGMDEEEKRWRIVFTEQADAYEAFNVARSSRISWKNVRKVIERDGYYEFWHNKYDVVVLLKQYFRDEPDHQAFRAILRDALEERAKLRS